MKKLLLAAAAGLGLAACAQPNTLVCDREAIAWDKWGEPSEMAENCLPSAPSPYAAVVLNERDTDDQSPRVVPQVPSTPSSPPSTPPSGPTPPFNPPSTPSDDKPDRVKGNNGHGNGDQAAPGRSGGRNNAENSDNSGQGNSGRGRGGLKGTPNNN